MNTHPVAPLRYVNSPTVYEEYEEDREGYDLVSDETTMVALSRENDKISGLESVYNYVLHRHQNRLTASTGTEGFIDSVKHGIGKLIQVVKDFFKWIWSFFGTKGKALKDKGDELEVALKANGVREDDIPYPKAAFYIFPKTPRLPSNVGWVSTVIGDIEGGIKTIERYSASVGNFCKELGRLIDHSKYTEFTTKQSAFYQEVKGLLGVNANQEATLVVKDDLVVGKNTVEVTINLTRELGVLSNDRVKNATFKTNVSQVRELLVKHNRLTESLKDMNTKVHSLENDFVTALMASLDVKEASPEAQAVIKEMKAVIRKAMASLKVMETEVYRSANAVYAVLEAAVKRRS